MAWITVILLLLGFFPLVQALRANRQTTLQHALGWAMAAWLAWIGVACGRALRPGAQDQWAAYAALCLTGCAGIAVLGARRPGVSAWNFVVASLLAVLLLPILKGLGEPRLEAAQVLFLCGTLAVPLLNYLPARLRWGISLIAAGCTMEMARVLGWLTPSAFPWLGVMLLALGPWTAWIARAERGSSATEFDRLWLSYRDRFGFVWGQRMRQQFNHAARNAGWPVDLRWGGLQAAAPDAMPDPQAMLAVLRAVLQRFQKGSGLPG